MGDNNWKTIPKAVFSPLTAGAALINRGTQVIEQNAANQAQADAVAMQEGRLDRLQAMDQEFASKGGFKTPDEMYANMYGYNDVNAYQQALRSGEFKPEQTMGEARAMLQRGTVRPVYGALAPQNNTPYTANVGNPQLPETPAIAPAPKPGAAPAVPAPGEPVQSKNNPPAPRLNPELRPVAEAAKPQPRVSPQLQQPTAAAQPQTDPAANQQQWEKRFLTETGTKYNPVSRADRASMQRMMGGDQTYNIQQWRSAGRPDAQPDFSVAYNSKPLRPNTQVAKKIAPTPVKTGELVRRNTGVTTADGELWANPADKDYLIKDARYSDLTWEEYTKLPPSKKAENIDTFFNTAEKTI
jgi:hypothetical protein